MSALFYDNPVLLDSGRHAAARATRVEGFAFAAAANAIPVNLSEVALAARSYPLVFGGSETTPQLAAVVGLQARNLFVDEAGAWRKGAYVPAYVRRYPFILADGPGEDQLSLCMESSALAEAEGEPLFEAGGPAPLARRALEFCQAYHAAAAATAAFTAALAAEEGLLVERQANAELTSGGAYVLQGFRAIDEAVVRRLRGKLLADWNGRNWLGPLFAIVHSTLNWGELVDLAASALSGEVGTGPPAESASRQET